MGHTTPQIAYQQPYTAQQIAAYQQYQHQVAQYQQQQQQQNKAVAVQR